MMSVNDVELVKIGNMWVSEDDEGVIMIHPLERVVRETTNYFPSKAKIHKAKAKETIVVKRGEFPWISRE